MFCKEIQLAIEQGRIEFDAPEKPMMIDRHPFPTNMVELKEKGADEEVKILTSGRAKHSGVVDLKSQASANQLGGQGRYDERKGSRRSRRCVTSQMLINKYQRRQEKEERRQQKRTRREADHW